MHPLNPVQAINTAPQTNHRRKKTRRRPCVAYIQFQRLTFSSALRNFPSQPANSDMPIARFRIIRLNFHLEPQLPQTFDHHLCVFAPQRMPQLHLAIAQGRQDQGTIGNAFGTWNTDSRRNSRAHRMNLNYFRKRHACSTQSTHSGDDEAHLPVHSSRNSLARLKYSSNASESFRSRSARNSSSASANRPIASSKCFRFITAISRHISGEPAAMRVLSRKPFAQSFPCSAGFFGSKTKVANCAANTCGK